MESTEEYWHFPSHDIPGTARPAKMMHAGRVDAAWQWDNRPDATAVAGSKLSVLYSRDSSKLPPYYPSTKSLAVERSGACEELTLFKDIPLDMSSEVLRPATKVRQLPIPSDGFIASIVFLLLPPFLPQYRIGCRARLDYGRFFEATEGIVVHTGGNASGHLPPCVQGDSDEERFRMD
jgi:hypothetical protein